MMRALALALLLALPFAGSAAAEETTTAPQITTVQQPAPGAAVQERRVNGYRVLAISAGALGGAVVGHALIGGAMPVVMGGGMAALQGAGTGFMVLRGAVVAGTTVAGGFIGNWLYGE